MKSSAKLKKIKGDASFREFYRNRKNKSIIVVSKKEKLKNLLIYDAINKILIKNKILAPNLLSENYINNYICLLYTSPSPRDQRGSRMPSSA